MSLQLLEAGKYGHSKRPGATGNLSIFSHTGALAAAAPDRDAFSLATHLGKQHAQPSSSPGVGLSSLQADRFTADGILKSQMEVLSSFIFGPLDSASTMPLTSVNRFKCMSSSPPEALLVCGKFVLSTSASGEVEYGDSVIFVLDAPTVPHRGAVVAPDAIWPGSSTLAPLAVPLPSGSISLLGGSTLSTPRSAKAAKMDKSLSSFLPHQVFCLEGLKAVATGWTLTEQQAQLSQDSIACFLTQSKWLILACGIPLC